MSVKFTSKNVKFTGALKAFTEKQLRSIERISGDIIDAEVIVNEEKLDFRVELTLKTKLHSYFIEDRDPILKQALRATLNTLKSQVKKNKEKLKKEKKRKNKSGVFKRFVPAGSVPLDTIKLKEETPANRLMVSDNFSRKPLSVEEALFFLKESGENAYMFMNAETNKIAVVFYNKNKSASIIEANIQI
ncbi:MAG: HPF/RaiA family ribosome-associated protein [Candidatus Aminicenantes bacterium]|nr:HPF/RaiA family ribosome-associated protein [Candidatus Aminicenantes bacterium]